MEEKRNVYVGHRYVPKVMGEWDKQETYEGLSIVTYQGASYTSKKRVPVGIDISNEEYWVVTGNYNAQIEEYRSEVNKQSNDLNSFKDETRNIFSDISPLKSNGIDDTEIIQSKINNNELVLLGKDTFFISKPLECKDNTTILGSGHGSIITPSVKFDTTKNRGFIDIVESKNVTLKDFKMDYNARKHHSIITSHLIMILSSQNIVLDNLYFYDIGLNDGTENYSNGGCLHIVGKDTSDERAEETHTNYKNIIGSVKNVTVKNCIFENPKGTNLGFAVRCLTSWADIEKRFEDYKHTVENITFDTCKFIGDYYWDTLEFAGGGTRFNKVLHCFFTGLTKTAIDFDKGTSYSIADGNTIIGAGKLKKWYSDELKRVAIIHSHGTGTSKESGIPSIGNKIINNTIKQSVFKDDPDINKSAISVSFTIDTIIENNIIDGTDNLSLGTGWGIFIDHFNENTKINNNIIKNGFRSAILENYNAVTNKDIIISNNTLESAISAISVANLETQDKTYKILGNTIKVLKDGVYYGIAIGFANEIVISDNHVTALYEGISVTSNYATISNNTVKGCSKHSYRVNGENSQFCVNGNISIDHGVNALINQNGTASIFGNGNNFTLPTV